MNKKKLLTVAALLTAAALICVLALAASGGTCGDDLTWTLDDQGTLTITGTGPMTSAPWTGWETINSVVRVVFVGGHATITDLPATGTDLPAVGITSIADEAFSWCSSLEEVVFTDSIREIGMYAFAGCSGLTTVTVPESVTVIREGAFDDCENLTIRCKYGSAAWDYAKRHNIPYELIYSNVVTLPEDLTAVGSESFADDPAIEAVRFHDRVTAIAANAFDRSVIIIAPSGSYPAQWASSNGYELITE